MYVPHLLVICSPVDGYLDCFHVLGIVAGAAMNVGCMYLLELWLCLGIYPGWDCWILWTHAYFRIVLIFGEK